MPSIKRNAPCPCGSGLKYKKCCLEKDVEKKIADRRRRRIVIAVILSIAALVGGSAITVSLLRPGPHDALAKCLTSRGYKMYGTHWCPNCAKQKAIFGKSFKYINYIECSPNGSRKFSEFCKAKGIKKIPTWIAPDGSKFTGTRSSMELSDVSSCNVGDSAEKTSSEAL